MNNTIKNIEALFANPFLLYHVFKVFYENQIEKDKNFLLSYLVLPLVLYPPSNKFLVNSKRTSSLRTLMNETDRIYGLNERIYEYKKITNLCLQYMHDNKIIKINDVLSISIDAVNVKEEILPERKYIIAAQKLSTLLNPFDVVTIYRKLGIKSI